MNKGMPNTAKKLSKALTLASGASGFWGWLVGLILNKVLDGAIQKGLVIADKAHVAIIVPNEADDWDEETDKAYEIIDQGKILTQEEKDEIDKPFMDTFIKLATFRLRKQSNNS